MKYTNRSDFPEILPLKKTIYCWKCKATTVEKVNGEQIKYKCSTCHQSSDRILIYDPQMEQKFDESGNLIHKSVGMFILNSEKEVLLFLRKKYPYLYTIPAGHISLGENPKEAAIREIKEEVNIDAPHVDLLYEGNIFGDECLGGADIHYWHLYKTYVSVEDIRLDEEGSQWSWFKIADIDLNKITYPVKYFLTNKDVLNKLKI